MQKPLFTTATLIAFSAFPALAARQDAAYSNPALFEIYINDQCRVFTQNNPAQKPKFHSDPAVCHFESEHRSKRWEYQPGKNGAMKRTSVTVFEHEYVLSNPIAQPVTFVVGQFLPNGWAIDSDPLPTEITNSRNIPRHRAARPDGPPARRSQKPRIAFSPLPAARAPNPLAQPQ